MPPLLSVLMPVYNGRAYLATALESIAAQHDAELEVIAVDDGSTDDSLDLLRAFAESFRGRVPLKILEGEHSGSWVRNTNRALAAATGEFIGFLHQDDVWEPGRLAALRRSIAAHPDAAMHFHPAWFVDFDGRRLNRWNTSLRAGKYAAGELHERLLVQNFIACPAPIVRRQTALDVGGLDERLWYTADWDFWLKASAAGPVAYVDEPLAAFRVHAESQTMQRSAVGDEFREQLVAALEPHARRWEQEHPDRGDVLRVARFSIEVNTALARRAHGAPAGLGRPAWEFLKLGPLGWRRYFRDSRIVDRVGARLRLKSRSAKRLR